MKKFFKRLGIVILVLAVVYLILCLFGPKDAMVTRSTTVNVTPEFAMSKLGDYKFFHDKWSPFTKLDSNMKTNYT
jgi:hypothetical protein